MLLQFLWHSLAGAAPEIVRTEMTTTRATIVLHKTILEGVNIYAQASVCTISHSMVFYRECIQKLDKAQWNL